MQGMVRIFCILLILTWGLAQYEKVAAVFMVRYSLLGYYPTQIRQGKGEEIKWLDYTDRGWIEHKKSNSYCCYGYDEILNAVVVVFRGTQAASLKNWNANFNVKLIPYEDTTFTAGSKVHQGYSTTYLYAFEQAASQVIKLIRKRKANKVYVTGHSLGGALAVLFALDLSKKIKKQKLKLALNLYTVGQPRLCNQQMAKQIDRVLPNYYRIVHSKDPIPGVPMRVGPCKDYHHAGTQYWFTSGMHFYTKLPSEHVDGANGETFFPKLLYNSDHDIVWQSQNMPYNHEQAVKVKTRRPSKSILSKFRKMDMVDGVQQPEPTQEHIAGGLPFMPSMGFLQFSGLTYELFMKGLEFEQKKSSYSEEQVVQGHKYWKDTQEDHS